MAATNPARKRFYQVMGQQLGPVSSAERRTRPTAGTVTPDTPVRKGADGARVRAEEAQGLFQAPPRNTIPARSRRAAGYGYVPYGLVFAWAWTGLMGYLLLGVCDFGRDGPPSLDPRYWLLVAAGLLVPVLFLVAPIMGVIIDEWRRTARSQGVPFLLVAILAIVVGLVAKKCRSPEPISTFGWPGTSAQQEEAKQTIGRLEDRFLKTVEPRVDQSGTVARGDSRNGKGARSDGVLGEVERLAMEVMDLGERARRDYQRELDIAGLGTFFDPTRLHNDKGFTGSRRILGNAKKAVQRYRAGLSSLLPTARLKIMDLSVSSSMRQEMLETFDRSAEACQPKMDRQGILEEKILGEAEKILNLLEAKSGSWTVLDGKLLFQSGQDAEDYNAFLSRIRQYAAEQEQIKKEAVDSVKAGFARMKEGAGFSPIVPTGPIETPRGGTFGQREGSRPAGTVQPHGPAVGEGRVAESWIHKAVGAKDAETVRAMVQLNPRCLLEMDEGSFGYTPLHTAAEHGFQDMAKLLLALGADVNVRARNGETPLITAVGEHYDKLALFFIAKGADVKASGHDGWTALHFAAIENMPALAQTLIDKGAVVDAKTVEGETPLDVAFEKKSREVVQVLLKNGAEIRERRGDGKASR
jgi:hypothetical protein